MTKDEQKAFVRAYADNIAHLPIDEVADFVSRYELGEGICYSGDHIAIVDALGIWHCAIKWQLEQL